MARADLLAMLQAVLLATACTANPHRPVPPVPTSDARFGLSEPTTAVRVGGTAAVVDCSMDVANRSGQPVARMVVTCELLDPDGVPVGAGLGSLQTLSVGENRGVRAVIYGVRSYASARAFVTSVVFQ